QVRDLFREAGEGAGVCNPGRRMAREAADVHFVNDGIFQRRQRRSVLAPVKGPSKEQAVPCADSRKRGCGLEEGRWRLEGRGWKSAVGGSSFRLRFSIFDSRSSIFGPSVSPDHAVR